MILALLLALAGSALDSPAGSSTASTVTTTGGGVLWNATVATLYVDGTLGTDSDTCGLASGASACLTIQRTVDRAGILVGTQTGAFTATPNVTINVAAGTYSEDVLLVGISPYRTTATTSISIVGARSAVAGPYTVASGAGDFDTGVASGTGGCTQTLSATAFATNDKLGLWIEGMTGTGAGTVRPIIQNNATVVEFTDSSTACNTFGSGAGATIQFSRPSVILTGRWGLEGFANLALTDVWFQQSGTSNPMRLTATGSSGRKTLTRVMFTAGGSVTWSIGANWLLSDCYVGPATPATATLGPTLSFAGNDEGNVTVRRTVFQNAGFQATGTSSVAMLGSASFTDDALAPTLIARQTARLLSWPRKIKNASGGTTLSMSRIGVYAGNDSCADACMTYIGSNGGATAVSLADTGPLLLNTYRAAGAGSALDMTNAQLKITTGFATDVAVGQVVYNNSDLLVTPAQSGTLAIRLGTVYDGGKYRFSTSPTTSSNLILFNGVDTLNVTSGRGFVFPDGTTFGKYGMSDPPAPGNINTHKYVGVGATQAFANTGTDLTNYALLAGGITSYGLSNLSYHVGTAYQYAAANNNAPNAIQVTSSVGDYWFAISRRGEVYNMGQLRISQDVSGSIAISATGGSFVRLLTAGATTTLFDCGAESSGFVSDAKVVTLKCVAAGACTVNAGAGDTIDGAASIALTGPTGAASFANIRCHGGNLWEQH